ncbi:MAG: hypothetical protein LBJ42_02040, partial [Holosporales bacterium]|nr:hypothetical protein [Holosporales bacterium]
MGAYNIAVLRDLSGTYSYAYDYELQSGQLVIVNFRNSHIIGVVVDDETSEFTGKLKK